MNELKISRLDDFSFLVECDDTIAQTFNQSEYGNMLKYISSYIKKLKVPDERKMFNPIDLASKIAKTKAKIEAEKKAKKKNPQTKLI